MLDLVVVPHEPGHVLGRVLAGLGGEVAEPPEQLDPDAALQVGRGVDDLGQPGIQRLAVLLEPQHECLMVEAGGGEVDRRRIGADQPGQEGVGVADRVAQAVDVTEPGAGVDRPGQHRHRVGVVEQAGVRAVR